MSGANWHIYKTPKGTYFTRLVAPNGYNVSGDKNFNRFEDAKENVAATMKHSVIMLPEVMAALRNAKTEKEVLTALDSLNHYGYLQAK